MMIKYLFLILGSILILLLAVFFLFKKPIKPVTPQPTILIEVNQISPVNKATDVGIYKEIVVNFSRELSFDEQKNLQIKITPLASLQKFWRNSSTLILLPSEALKTEQKYDLKLAAEKFEFNSSFITSKPEEIPISEQVKYQTETDKKYADLQKLQDQEYPWLQDLPLQSKDYFVYFEIENQTFTAELNTSKISPKSQDAQINQLKSEVNAKLQSIGIDISKYNIKWVVREKND